MIDPLGARNTMLRQAAIAPQISIEALAPPGCLLIVTPHPDDETLGCGAALATAVAVGRKVAIVLCTDGEGSHPNSFRFGPEQLVALRRTEFEKALNALAPGAEIPILRLHLPDGSSHISAMSEGDFVRIAAFARDNAASAIWTTWIGDPHCDHQTAALFSRKLAEGLDVKLFSFPIWGRFGTRSVPSKLYIFASDRHAEAKRRAIAAYASQTTDLVGDDPAGFTMPQELVCHFADHPEIFIHER